MRTSMIENPMASMMRNVKGKQTTTTSYTTALS